MESSPAASGPSRVPQASYRLLDKSPAVTSYLRELGRPPALAIDLEADSLYSYQEKACLVQITTAAGNVILDPLGAPEGMQELGPLLADGSILKVFHGADYDIRLLKKAFGFAPHNIVDTAMAAQLLGRPAFGLAALLSEDFGLDLAKGHQRDDWARRPLNPQQLLYAALDTAYLLPLWERLRGQLERLGRLEWAEEEFALLEQVTPAPPREPSWLDVKGTTHLTPQQRAILHNLVLVRDEAARSWDRPPFKVLSDRVLISWALEPPSTREQVYRTATANLGILRRLAPRVLAAVHNASEANLPRRRLSNGVRFAPLTTEQKERVVRLKQVREEAAACLGIHPGLLVTSETLERMARLPAGEVDAGLESSLKRWQRSVLESELKIVLEV